MATTTTRAPRRTRRLVDSDEDLEQLLALSDGAIVEIRAVHSGALAPGDAR